MTSPTTETDLAHAIGVRDGKIQVLLVAQRCSKAMLHSTFIVSTASIVASRWLGEHFVPVFFCSSFTALAAWIVDLLASTKIRRLGLERAEIGRKFIAATGGSKSVLFNDHSMTETP